MELKNRTVLVTGANRGMGRELVVQLLAAGARKVYAAARRAESLPDFADPRVMPLALDITDPAQVHRAASEAGDVDLLVNNAGRAAFASLLDAAPEELRADLETNYFGTLEVIRAFLPVLEAKADAAIVNVVSIAAFVNFPGLGGYSASKAALFSLSQGIRIELAARGIGVHTVNPGPVDTDMARDLEMPKTSPREVVTNILDSLRRGEADIFPDPTAAQMFEVWRGDYRELEKTVAQMQAGG